MALVERGITDNFNVLREPDPQVRGIAVSGGQRGWTGPSWIVFPSWRSSPFRRRLRPIDAAAAERGVVVTNTPDVLTEEVADTALGLLIGRCELPQAERWLRAAGRRRAPTP